MNCRKRAGGSKFTRGISQRARAVAITATLGKTRYVNSNWSTDLNMKLRLPGPMPHRKINIF